ncbi:ADP-ribosylation factor-binding protein GGA3 isoform X2 [Pectinophora gossypiella]|uniref:ADP-ribosylation factor-binding protein GGA3 isoform X2 n=1 Tax=Pectinophora gossypiella TaxID=13191 RepID=UPI00214ED479|nr:ADP-ribosylation factor-binding protein GGA3 isoform X2 [Pectinophora gossypiella]
MNVTLTSLEALILKATHETLPCPDAAALEAFCAIMRDSTEGPMLAAQTLAARIHTPNPREALLALTMLDRCMRRCDANFHAEVGKFRFLNEMIKLVSPKYFADRTAPEVRTRVLQLLHAWSIEYPKETKFKVAFDMLKNQGVVKETPPPLPPEDTPPPRARVKSAIFEDEEKSKLLQKLLQSKKPEDLQHANRLIKTMVKEEERRSEASSRRAQEVSAALDSAGLLRDMLQRAADASSDELQLIHELHAACTRLRPALQRLAAAHTHQDDINDIVYASDVLDEVFEIYNTFIAEQRDKPKPDTQAASSDSLLDFAGAKPRKGEGDEAKTEEKPAKNSVIDELGDIFSSEGGPSIAEPLKPVNLMGFDVAMLEEKSTKAEGWNELDSLGEQLLKQSLPENAKRIDSFNSKPAKKIPMKALENVSPKHETPANNGAILDLDYFTKKPEEPRPIHAEPKPFSPTDDVMVDITKGATSITSTNNNSSPKDSPLDNILDIGLTLDNVKVETVENKETEKTDIVKKTSDVKPLSDIHVTLQNVQPSKVAPMTVFEEEGGVTVVLHFCKDKPRPDVNVIVVSTTSKCKSPIEDYKFQAVVPKGCKVRLLTPSGTRLPARNPFLPPPALTQVLLLARAAPPPPASLKFVITYTCEDDTYSEIGEVKQLPLDDI